MIILNNVCENSENFLQYFLIRFFDFLNFGTVIKRGYVNFESVTVFKKINWLPWKWLLSAISSALEWSKTHEN